MVAQKKRADMYSLLFFLSFEANFCPLKAARVAETIVILFALE
jgi:hypothetical protein